MGRMLLVALLAAGLVPVAYAAGETTHSGQLVAIAPGGHEVTVKEMGPWDGKHQAIRTLSIRLTPATTIEMVARSSKTEPGAWVGGFQETPVSVAALQVGQYVTIKTQLGRAHHLVADTVEIVRPDGAPGAKA